MTDRELLELAAKAAGYKYEKYVESEGLWLNDSCPDYGYDWWNPLDDDGDALRLAIDIGVMDGPKSFAKFYPWLDDALKVIDDHRDAFKRAITCYAAEIGKSMQAAKGGET